MAPHPDQQRPRRRLRAGRAYASEPDRALLRRDRHRLVVGDRRLSRGQRPPARGTRRRRTPSRGPPRASPSQVDAALDQGLRPLLISSGARPRSEVPPSTRIAATASAATSRSRDGGPEQAVAQRRRARRARQQRDEARLREPEQQAGEDHRGKDRQRIATARESPRPEQAAAAISTSGERQIAAVDVRVPEERVDAEVEVEVVRALERRVPEDLAGDALADADQRESGRLAERRRPGSPRGRRGVQRTSVSSTNMSRERDQEERDVARCETRCRSEYEAWSA